VDAELCLLRLCDPTLDLDAGSLNARLSRVEDQLATGRFVQAAPAAAAEEDDDRPPMPDDSDAPPVWEDAPPVPAFTRPEDAPSGFWADFVAKLKPEVPNGSRGFFSVEGPVRPLLEGDTLTLVADTEFTKKMIDKPTVTEPAARIASALLGRPMRLRCTVRGKTGPAVGAADPMDALMSFGRQHEGLVTFQK